MNTGNLGQLGNWPVAQASALKKLEKLVRRKDKDGNPWPLDAATITALHEWLVGEFDIPRDLVEAPSFTLKVFHHFKAKTLPEPSLLNSFFLDDIGLASQLVLSGKQGEGSADFLGFRRLRKQLMCWRRRRRSSHTWHLPRCLKPAGLPAVTIHSSCCNKPQ
ncbi:hypothetical protein [Agrobacterium fabrum]|uniref:hypothetical protein n=1 Tax=Agrobacterium fabrum TaxID=1176649 RepID=UPI003BA1A3CA